MESCYAEVIGNPVGHSKSPAIHDYWLRALGIDGRFHRTPVTSGDLKDFLGSRRQDQRWRGCSVTIPHKESVLPYLDEVRDGGIGAVNCIVSRRGSLIGYNTDALGLEEALASWRDAGPVCLIGTGGAARAALAALRSLRLAPIHMVARDRSKGELLLRYFAAEGQVFEFEQAQAAFSSCAGAINTTPLGMTGQPQMPPNLLQALADLRSGAFALDMVYVPLRTRFLKLAEKNGVNAIDGLGMLIGQARHAFRLFFEAEAPRRHDVELRELLTR